MSTGADDLRRQAELLELLKTRDAVLEAHHEHDATLAALEESRRGPDHGISPAQLREKVEALDLVVKEAYRAIDALNTRAADTERRVVELERLSVSLLDRVNQLVEFHGIRPIGQSPKAECTREELLKALQHSRVSQCHCDHTGIGKPGCLVCDVREKRR